MRSILLVGSVGAGKTTLRKRLQGGDLDYAKTQAIEVHDGVIDTPGEFLESMFYKNALINASWGVDSVVLVQAADLRGTRFPPGFSTAFNREVLGVVTKCAEAPDAHREAAVGALKLAGAGQIFCLDSVTGDGVEDLLEVLCQP